MKVEVFINNYSEMSDILICRYILKVVVVNKRKLLSEIYYYVDSLSKSVCLLT